MRSVKKVLSILVIVVLCAGCDAGEYDTSDSSVAAGRSTTVSKPSPRPPVPSKRLSDQAVLSKMQSAGMKIERLEKTWIYPDQQEKLPAEPRQVFSIRVWDGDGCRTSMTLVEFKDANQASMVKGVNGFSTHNWFFLGIINNHFVEQVKGALT